MNIDNLSLLDSFLGFIIGLLVNYTTHLLSSSRNKYKSLILKRKVGLNKKIFLITIGSISRSYYGVSFAHEEIQGIFILSDFLKKIEVNHKINFNYTSFSNNDDIKNSVANEICVGGPLSNNRTKLYLSRFFPDFSLIYSHPNNSKYLDGFNIQGQIVIRGKKTEIAFIFRIEKEDNTVIYLLFGITAEGSLAASYYFIKNFFSLKKIFGSNNHLVLIYSLDEGYKSVRPFNIPKYTTYFELE